MTRFFSACLGSVFQGRTGIKGKTGLRVWLTFTSSPAPSPRAEKGKGAADEVPSPYLERELRGEVNTWPPGSLW